MKKFCDICKKSTKRVGKLLRFYDKKLRQSFFICKFCRLTLELKNRVKEFKRVIE